MMLKKFHNTLIDLLYPRRCAGCDKVLDSHSAAAGICTECREKLKPIREPHCMKCGAALESREDEYCSDCAKRRHIYKRGLALYAYDNVREPIYRMKYSGRKEYCRYFGREMARRLGREIKSWEPQALIPIPLYAAKLRRRGYNQAQALAESLSEALHIPVKSGLVKRTRNTRPMKLLGDKERQINLKNAFLITQDVVKLETVVLVDDIYTTGSTIDAVAACLRRAGVKTVYYVALAIGSGV